MFDVSITHPLCPSYVADAASSSLAAAKAREIIKVRKYKDFEGKFHCTFFPAVVETTGGFGKMFSQSIEKMIKASKAASGSWAPRGVVYGLGYAVAVAVAKGNASMVERALRWAERA